MVLVNKAPLITKNVSTEMFIADTLDANFVFNHSLRVASSCIMKILKKYE